MAISQMKKVSLLFPRESLDAVLTTLQSSESLELQNITEGSSWQEVYDKESFSFLDSDVLENEEALSALSQRQQALETTISKLEGYIPKEGLFKRLRQPDITYSFSDLERFGQDTSAQKLLDEVNDTIHHLQVIEKKYQQAESRVNQLIKWRNLDVTPRELSQLTFIKGQIGTIPTRFDDEFYRKLKENTALTFQEVFQNELEYGVIIFSQASQDFDLTELEFTPFDYDEEELPAQVVEQIDSQMLVWHDEKKRLLTTLQNSQERLQDLKVQTDYVMSLYQRQLAKKNLLSTKHLSVLEGWIEADHVQYLQVLMTSQFGNNIYVQEADVTEGDWEKVPIKLRNHPLIEPFELVTEMYALPKYNEKDPTPILAPFYVVFFGMMVADLGYGLLMVLVTSLALTLFNLPKGNRRFLKFFDILGVSVFLWGLAYGSLFGYELPFHILSTTTDVMSILILSVVFGFITVIVGLTLGGMQHTRMKDYAEAYNSGFAWVLILIGILLLALGVVYPNLSFLVPVGSAIAILNAIGIVAVSIVQAKSLSGLGSGIYNLYNISSYVGDLVSFTRLMALGLSGASIGTAFNLIVDLFPGIWKLTFGLILFVTLHAINIFLSLLSGYVHGARLIFVEFFGKFYEGGGKSFRPLKASEKYITVTRNTQSEES